jgi:TPR repeat protein
MPFRLSCHRLMPGLALLLLAPTLAMAPTPAIADVEAGVRAFEAGDYQAAIDEWRGDAAQGNANALFNLGQAYRLGRGVAVDLDQAETYYQRAADAGHPAAMGNLATLYYFSKKPPRVADAVYWWEQGARAGDPRSQYILGAMTFNGDPVKKDVPTAYAWTWAAAQAGLPEAKTALDTMRPYVEEADREAAPATALGMMTPGGKTYWRAQLPGDVMASPDEVPPAGPAWRINLASMASREDAEATRRAVMAAHGGLLAAMPLRIVRAEQDGRTYFRLQAGRFDTAPAAQAQCDRMKAEGLDCFVLRGDD